jgi:hypothetical protein
MTTVPDWRDPRFVDRLRETIAGCTKQHKWITTDLDVGEENFVVDVADEILYFIADWTEQETRQQRYQFGLITNSKTGNTAPSSYPPAAPSASADTFARMGSPTSSHDPSPARDTRPDSATETFPDNPEPLAPASESLS